jgi:plasmid stabilization system protein ParE
MIEFLFTYPAEQEYEAVVAWYLARSRRAAVRFEEAVEAAMELIARFPEGSPLVDDVHRYCKVRRFPYGLVYRVRGDLIQIITVPHDRQLPTYRSPASAPP